VHPGEILRETLAERGISQSELARRMGVTRGAVNQLCAGSCGIGPVVALRLEAELGVSARLWLHLQADYGLHVARQAATSERRTRELSPDSRD
jgi:addiction module HigA family antidote